MCHICFPSTVSLLLVTQSQSVLLTRFPIIFWVIVSSRFQSLYSRYCIPTPSPPNRRMIASGWWFELIDFVSSVGESQIEKIKTPLPELSSCMPWKKIKYWMTGQLSFLVKGHTGHISGQLQLLIVVTSIATRFRSLVANHHKICARVTFSNNAWVF